MKVIKRDGRAVEFNKEKITVAIEKANKEVKHEEQAKKKDINKIIKSIENIDKKRILVEDIQDIIEEKLMELGKFKLAKKYIVYRYTRTLVRKQNTTDKSIFGIIKNSDELNNQMSNIISQRDYIASEVSKDITKRFLLPEKINNAIDEGILYFNDSNYFVNPIFKSSFIDLNSMFENKIILNNEELLSPNSFLEACINTITILQNVCQNQYGEATVNINCLSKYIKISKNKKTYSYNKLYKNIFEKNEIKKLIDKDIEEELINGVNILLNPSKLIANDGNPFKIVYILDLNSLDPFQKITAKIFERILKQKKNNNYPKLIYIINEENNLNNGSFDYLTTLALKINKIKLISQKVLNDNYRNSYFILGDDTFIKSNKKGGKFSLGTVSLNLSQIGILSKGDEKKLNNLLDERLELCLESLMIRYYALKGNKANISPIHYMYGGISHLENDDLIDNLLKKSAVLTLSYYGLEELARLFTKNEDSKNEFSKKILTYLKDTINKWTEEKGINFILYSYNALEINKYFIEKDKEKFGIIKNITDKESYTNNNSNIKKDDIKNEKEFINDFYKNILYTEIYKNS